MIKLYIQDSTDRSDNLQVYWEVCTLVKKSCQKKFRKQVRNLYHDINNMVKKIIKALIIHKLFNLVVMGIEPMSKTIHTLPIVSD